MSIQSIFEKCCQLLPSQRISIACQIGMRPRAWPSVMQTSVEQVAVLMAWADRVDRLDLLEAHINSEMGAAPPMGRANDFAFIGPTDEPTGL